MKKYIEPDSYVTSTNGVNVELREYETQGGAAGMHLHSSIEALYFKKGAFDVYYNGENYILNGGDLIYFRKNAIHSVNTLSPDGGSYYVLKIHPSMLHDFSNEENTNSFQFFFSLDSKEQKCIWRKDELEKSEIYAPLKEIARECDDDGIFSFMSLKINAGKFLLSIMRDSHKRNPEYFNFAGFGNNIVATVRRAVEHINSNYSFDLTTKDFAEKSNFSYAYFSSCFTQITGESFKQYLAKTRIKYAKSELLNSSRSISEVGQAVGYNSASHFILEFKKQTGMTPLEFLKKHKK